MGAHSTGTASHRQGGTKPYRVPPHGLSPPSTQTWVLRDKIPSFTSRIPLSWEDFPGGHPSWYYSCSGTLNCGVLMGSGAFVLNQLSGTRLVKLGILSLRTQAGWYQALPHPCPPTRPFASLDSNLDPEDKISGFTSRVPLSWFNTKAPDPVRTRS
ncbi:hypothetical protein Sjap_010685 [Stephania japonica]|uniref:Uncharacterized protein n=1 Tax=Stephania japonica TaxID=461633 RepID=A0AAP0JA26_9MAGN